MLLTDGDTDERLLFKVRDFSLNLSALRLWLLAWCSHSVELLRKFFKLAANNEILHADGWLFEGVFMGAVELCLFIKGVPLSLPLFLELFFLKSESF